MTSAGEFVAAETKSKLRSNVSKHDISSIWEYVSQYIQDQLKAEKGVSVSNLGTFTFSRKSLHVGNGVLSIQRPIFNLSSQLMQMYRLTATKHFTSGDVTVIPLNFSAVAALSPYSRDTVQDVVDLIVREIPRALQQGKKVDLLINGVGRLLIRDSQAKFRWFREFLNTLDDSGKTEQVFRLDSQGTRADPSVMSRNQSHAAANSRSSTVQLPRLVCRTTTALTSPGRCDNFETIAESPTGLPADREADEEVPLAAGMHPDHTDPRGAIAASNGRYAHSPTDEDARKKPGHASSGSSSPSEGTECSHGMGATTGDLCYLCHQRASRNVPVSFQKEIRQKEDLEEQQMVAYNLRQQQLYFAKERARELQAMDYTKSTQRYNWHIARGKEELKAARNLDFQKSFLMHKRPPSPSKTLQQLEYGRDLRQQMKEKTQAETSEERQRQRDERLEQIRLADQLSSSYKAYMSKKEQEAQDYGHSLRQQIQWDSSHSSDTAQPDTSTSEPAFPDTHVSQRATRWLKDREVAKQVMAEQLRMSELKARRKLEARREEKERERNMLIRAKNELHSDFEGEAAARAQVKADLLASWNTSQQEKAMRDREELLARKHKSTHVLEQCKEYERCHQCLRDKAVAAGTSHVMKDGHFAAGYTMMM